MKVIAKHWVNYNGVWHKSGDEFEVNDFEAVKDFAVKGPQEAAQREEYVSEVFPPVEQPKRRGRPKKAQ